MAALAVTLLTALAGCSSSGADKAGPTATVPTAPATTTTTNPYAVPPVIDAAYVNRVLAGLDEQIGEVTRMVIRTNTIPPEAFDRLKALYADSNFLQIKIDGYQHDILDGFRSYKPDPGNKTSIVSKIITARPTCVFAEVTRNYSSVGVSTLPGSDVQWVGLTPLDPSRDPSRYNPTTWAYTYDGFPPSHLQPANPCAS